MIRNNMRMIKCDNRMNVTVKMDEKSMQHIKHRKNCESALWAKKGFIQSPLLLYKLSVLYALSALSVMFALSELSALSDLSALSA